MPARAQIVPLDQLDGLIHLVRGQKVMLDSDLAGLYGVPTKVLNQAVRRNAQRFPEDFMFQLAAEEAEQILRSQIVTTSSLRSQDLVAPVEDSERSREITKVLRSQFVTSKTGSGGRRYRPHAFTEQGVAMLSSVLHSPRAIQVNIKPVSKSRPRKPPSQRA